MPTRNDVIAMAFNRMGMGLFAGQAPEAHEGQLADALLVSAFEECQEEALAPWSLDDVPQEAVMPLATLLAVDLAPSFNMAPIERRGTAKLRVMALIRPDDRLYDETPRYF